MRTSVTVERLCRHCSTPFLVAEWRIKSGRGVFCSKACWQRAHQDLHTTKICQHAPCGRSFTIPPNVLRNGRGRFCSRACMNQAQRLTTPLVTRLWESIRVCEHGMDCPYCCWPWEGTRFSTGYGRLSINRQDFTTSRLIWEVWHEQSMPPERYAAHHCNYPPCNNPDHLYAATASQNAADAIRIGTWTRGEQHHRAKLAETDILDIFALKADGWSRRDIALMYDVTYSCIAYILRRETWQHIEVPAMG